MGSPGEPALVKPIVGVLAASRELLAAARGVVGSEIGATDLASEPVEWTVSAYYRHEMGDEIWRQYLSLADLMLPDELAGLKLRTNQLEQRWRTERGRSVNLDPGYVGLLQVVLASTKEAAHRVYLRRGIYAEATLRYLNGRFVSWPYTYRDYAAADAGDFFSRVRSRLRVQRRSASSPPGRPAG